MSPLRIWRELIQSDARRVDIDNLQKAVLDGLQPFLFVDDSKILNISAWKRISTAAAGAEWLGDDMLETESQSRPDYPSSGSLSAASFGMTNGFMLK